MIFATVGTQRPFPRFLELIATWARAHPHEEIILQGGPGGALDADNVTCHETLDPVEFDRCMRQAEVVVAHAGVGTILAARDLGVPLVLVPRQADRGEHRNDHQLDTVAALEHLPGIQVVRTAEAFAPAIERARAAGPIERGEPAPERRRLAEFVTDFVGAPRPSAVPSEPTFVLYRIIGNDLVPRHRKGQSRANLRFILEHEPELAGCEKRFVLNRIVDPDEEARIRALLDDAGIPYVHLPFDPEAYARAGWDIAGVPLRYAPFTRRFRSLKPDLRDRVIARLYRHRNNAVMNNNGARNAALADGRARADWVLPFDGNCFFTRDAWEALRRTIADHPECPYGIVPMLRLDTNEDVLQGRVHGPPRDEPQILFRSDARQTFDTAFFYGERPKVELLWRLGVPGPWDRWRLRPWDLPRPAPTPDAGAWVRAGWVARLASGRADLEVGAAKTTLVNRGQVRRRAVTTLLDELDRQYAPPCLRPDRPVFVNAARAEADRGDALHAALREAADAALARPPGSVLDKTTLAPSGDPHDYWHPAPYYWPNPIPIPGLPYIKRDGRRVPGTRLYEPGSESYDRTALQRLFDDTFVLALAARDFGDERYARHAADKVRRWFLDPATAMNPNLEYAQVRRGRNGNRGASFGLIEFKDLYYFLDAVRLLYRGQALDAEEYSDFRSWLQRYLHWLRTSPQGRRERRSENNHGTYHDLQIAAIAAFLGDHFQLRDTLRDSRFRILAQFRPDGAQPRELARTNTAHYCCFNLQGWMNLATLADAHGEDLWHFEGPAGEGIEVGARWLLQYVDREWPYREIEASDRDRFLPIAHAARARYGLEPASGTLPEPARIKPVFHPDAGIRPFWQLR